MKRYTREAKDVMLKDSTSINSAQNQTSKIAPLSPMAVKLESASYPSLDSVLRRFYWVVLGLCFLAIVLKVISRFGVNSIWDDSFMFVRYSSNFLNSGTLSWNPGGEPTYGLTSLFYLVIILPVRLVVGYQPGLIPVISSITCGFVFLTLVGLLLQRYTVTGVVARRAFILLTFFSFATSLGALGEHLTNGMDTAFTMSFVTIFLIFGKRYEQNCSLTNIFLLGLWGGLAFATRPDLVLYGFGLPMGLVIFGPHRLKSLAVLAITANITGGVLLLNSLYFKTPLPLPFYAKGLKLYGDHIFKVYNGIAWQELISYFNSYWFFFALIGLNIMLNFKGWWKRNSTFDKSLLAITLVFLVYYAFFVLQIMGFSQRFYYPTLPILLYLACQSTGQLFELLINLLGHQLRFLPRTIWLSSAAVVWLLAMVVLSINLFPVVVNNSKELVKANTDEFLGHFDVAENYRKTFYARNWFRLNDFSALPDDLVIATTEVGYPAALNPGKIIVDMAGLNEKDFALNQFSAEGFFEKYRPDLIYLPHPDYKPMIEALTTYPYYLKQYQYFPRQQLGTDLFGIAIRRDSKYYKEMLEIVVKPKEPDA